jgi:hypothetical protein
MIMRKNRRKASAVSADVPTADAELEIIVDARHGQARGPDDALLTAFYLQAEQTRVLAEPHYDVEEGLQRFSIWLDEQTGMSASETATGSAEPGLGGWDLPWSPPRIRSPERLEGALTRAAMLTISLAPVPQAARQATLEAMGAAERPSESAVLTIRLAPDAPGGIAGG